MKAIVDGKAYDAFETERLILRPCMEEDAAFIFELLNCPSWLKYIGDRGVGSQEESRIYIQEKMYPQLKRLGFGNYTVIRKCDGIKIGTCGIYDREGMEGVDIGFAFLPDFENKGYGYEASAKILHAAFEKFAMTEVKAITAKYNLASQKLLEKLGLHSIGTTVLPNDDEEILLYAIDKSKYKASLMLKILTHPLVLGEGAINERIRRSSLQLHPILANASLIYGDSRKDLAGIYKSYLELANTWKLPMFIYTPTWKANKDRVMQAGIATEINRDACRFMQEIRDEYPAIANKVMIGGLFGPKNDSYLPEEALPAIEAEEFHSWQIDQLAKGEVDFLVSETVPALSEALGIAIAASKTKTPYIISFVINRKGEILDGTPLDIAFKTIDRSVEIPPVGFAINCAHPSFLVPEKQNKYVFDRLISFNANASSLDHCELENADSLHVDDVAEWGDLMLVLNREYGVTMLGGCCGTGVEHLQYLVDGCGLKV